MSSVTVCKCPQNTPDPACLRAVSSRSSDQQQKNPTAVRADPVAWRWRKTDSEIGVQWWVGSRTSRYPWSDTEELNCAGIGTWAMSTPSLYWARSGTSSHGARWAWVVTDRSRIFGCHWQRARQRSTLVAAYLLWFSALQRKLHCSSPYGSTRKRGQVWQPSRVIVGCDGVVIVWRSQQHKHRQRAYQDLWHYYFESGQLKNASLLNKYNILQ